MLSGNTNGVYIHWDRISNLTDIHYDIYRSPYFDGNYTLIDSVNWPINEYIDETGDPSAYYKIVEMGVNDQNQPIILNTSQPMVGEELLIIQSLMYELDPLLNMAVYDEEALFNRDRTIGKFAYKNWNYHPKPEIRITGSTDGGTKDAFIILDENESIDTTSGTEPNYPNGLKYKLDYQGQVYFIDDDGAPVEIEPYDIVYASYYTRLFTGKEINDAAYMALQTINGRPGATQYSSLAQTPLNYDPVVVNGAMYYLIRRLLLSLTQRERRLLVDDPDKPVGMNNLKDSLAEYKERFSEEAMKSVAISRYPRMYSVVTPEYMMPGGRSRFFRYIWKGEA